MTVATTISTLAMDVVDTDEPIFVFDSGPRYPKLPALAERLGVKPDQFGGYDPFDLVNAVLDRLDAATKP